VEKIWEAADFCLNSSILRGAPWRNQDLPLQLRREAAEREMLEEGLGLPPEADALAQGQCGEESDERDGKIRI